MRFGIMTVLAVALLQADGPESARAVEPAATRPEVIATQANSDSRRVQAAPVGWGFGRWYSRSASGTKSSKPTGRTSSSQDFWRGYYGSRTFSYGGVNARPGYPPGPP